MRRQGDRTNDRRNEPENDLSELLDWAGEQNTESFKNWLMEYRDLLARVSEDDPREAYRVPA